MLAPETIDAMSRNQRGELRVTLLRSVLPTLSNDAEFFPGLPKGCGLPFHINLEDAPTGLPADSLAWAGLANSFYWIDPKNGIGAVYLSQILPFEDAVKSYPLCEAFQATVYRSRR